MNAVAEMPCAVRHEVKVFDNIEARQEPRGGFAIGLVLALGIHAVVLFGWQRTGVEQAEFGVETADSSVEVSLVAALPADELTVEQSPESEPKPQTPTTEPDPIIPLPPEAEKPPEMTLPEPLPPPPRVELRSPSPPKLQLKPSPPTRTARASGDGSSSKPGLDATTAQASAGAASAKPGYLRNPHPAYPEEARKARQEGIVQLRVSVDGQGRVTRVQIIRSSGYAILDERARSTVLESWMFKPARIGGVAVATEVTVPIRFTLTR